MRLSRAEFANVALATSALLALPLDPAIAAATGKAYIDPLGRFALEIPQGFAQSKRTSSTGTIFVAGNFPRAATLSVVAWPLKDLLAEDARAQALPGIDPPKVAELPQWPALLTDVQGAVGGENALYKLILRKRDRESSSGALTSSPLGSATTVDERYIVWSSTTELPVADPEELYRQRGIRQLIRRTTATSWLGVVPESTSNERAQPALISICGSALESDWDELGPPIEAAVKSFTLGSAALPGENR